MFGCLRRVGCLVVLIVLAVAAWLTRELWWERATGRPLGPTRTWTSVEPTLAPAARRRIQELRAPGGEVFATLTPAEAGAIVLSEAGGRLPPAVQEVETSVVGDALSIRASVDLSALQSMEGLGPIAGFLTSRQRLTITGRPHVAERGRGTFDVQAVSVGGVEVPGPAIGVLIGQLDRNAPTGMRASTRAISFSLPPWVGDIRVARGRVILYKSTP